MKTNKYIIIILFLFTLASFIVPQASTSNTAYNTVLPTKLSVFVIDELGNYVPEAEVTLYGSRSDYEQEKNPLFATQITNVKGKVTFKKLKPTTYFVHVKKGDLNNNGGGIKTEALTEGRHNKINIVID